MKRPFLTTTAYWFLPSIVLTFLCLSGVPALADSPLLQNPDNGHWYQRIDTQMTWHDAKQECERLGGHLATLTSEAEDSFVFANFGHGFLGGTDELVEGDWVWVTGEPWDYTNWAPGGEPTNCCPPPYCAGPGCTPEHYLVYYGPPYDDQWNDVPNTEDPFICEWDSDLVPIDIKHGSFPNAVNCTNENSLIPVAILSGPEFDATTVDHASVTFEGAGELHTNTTGELIRHEEDVDDDGDLDLVLHFALSSTSLSCLSSQGVLIGETFDGVGIWGKDSLQMVGGLRFRKQDLLDAVFVIEDDDGINILKLAGDGEFFLWYQEFDPHAVGEARGAWAVDSSGNLVIDWSDAEEDTLLTLLSDSESFMDVLVWGGDEGEIVRLEKVIPFDAGTLPGNYYATRDYDPAWYAMATVNADGTGTAVGDEGVIWRFLWLVNVDGRLDLEFFDPAPALNHIYLLAASAAGNPLYAAGTAMGPGGLEEVFLEIWWLQP